MASKNMSNTSSTISFKSAGTKIDAYNASKNVETVQRPPIGIKTPLQLNNGDLFKMHYMLEDQIADNLRNLILTNKGERLGNPAFGTTLKRVQFDQPNKEDADIAAMATIQQAVRNFMPFVTLTDFTTTQLPPSMVNSDNADDSSYPGGALLIRITYTVPQIGNVLKGLQLMLPMGV